MWLCLDLPAHAIEQLLKVYHNKGIAMSNIEKMILTQPQRMFSQPLKPNFTNVPQNLPEFPAGSPLNFIAIDILETWSTRAKWSQYIFDTYGRFLRLV